MYPPANSLTAASAKPAFFHKLSTGYKQFGATIVPHNIAGIDMVTSYSKVVNVNIDFVYYRDSG